MGYVETTRASEAAGFGGLVDAIGGIATIVLAIVALTGVRPEILVPITIIVFGAALLIQAGAMVSEYALFMPAGAGADFGGANSLSSLFLVGAAGIVLGVLALLGIATTVLTSVAVIAFGAALLLSANSVRNLYLLRRVSTGSIGGGELLAGEMASGSAAVQLLAGLTAVVLGILAVTGARADILTLSAMIVLGATVVLSGSALSGMVLGFMRPARASTMP